MTYAFRSIIAAALISVAGVASAEKLPLNNISNYFNALKTASGDFTQINGDGTGPARHEILRVSDHSVGR